MGRKNVLNLGLSPTRPTSTLSPAPLPETSDDSSPRREVPEAIRRGAVGAMGNDLLSNSLREIDPEFIEDDGLRDRLAIDEPSLLELREQIRVHGQRVPILVRPIKERPGRFRVIYGRRRLAAIRPLGIKVKALVRQMDDQEAVLTQAQENIGRVDPSFIERALFADDLRQADYPSAFIQDALSVEKSGLSKMKAITDAVPRSLILVIGAAHGVGRRRWEDLARLLEEKRPENPVSVCFPEPPSADITSARRLELAIRRLQRVGRGQPESSDRKPSEAEALASGDPAPSRPQTILLKDGRAIAKVKRGSKALDLRISRDDHPGFSAWLEAKAELALRQLYRQWAEESGSD